jgi:integrase
MPKNINFDGPFRKEMQDFIDLMKSTGYSHSTVDAKGGILRRYGSYLKEHYPDANELTREVVSSWCSKDPNEKSSNQNTRVSAVRQFAKYLRNIGTNAWVPPANFCKAGAKYVPHIYTADELQRFLAETDKCTNENMSIAHRDLIMPIFFRLLATCGLRCSEAMFLKVDNVDLENGVLTIINGKNHNNRLVPMPVSLIEKMQAYAKQVHPFMNPGDYFFPGRGGRPISHGIVYYNFRKFLWNAGISHTGDGPRVHDFRHTFCVYRFKEWSEKGKDLMVLIPILRTYLGHKDFKATAYYLRLTADVFPDIRLRLEKTYPDIIPNAEEVTYETD